LTYALKERSRAVFLDRDGVITKNIYYAEWGETEGPVVPEDIVILPGVFNAMRRFSEAGYKLFIVSNQGAFAKGKVTLGSLVDTARRVDSLIREEGINLEESYYSFSHPDGVVDFFSGPSLERKPNPYFLKIASASYDLEMACSWMIGDRATDIKCGKLAGCRTALIAGGVPGIPGAEASADISADTLLAAADIIVSL
jgi:D-glycero-D-manno-heptose 1,7-bisphosphate phosphatase